MQAHEIDAEFGQLAGEVVDTVLGLHPHVRACIDAEPPHRLPIAAHEPVTLGPHGPMFPSDPLVEAAQVEQRAIGERIRRRNERKHADIDPFVLLARLALAVWHERRPGQQEAIERRGGLLALLRLQHQLEAVFPRGDFDRAKIHPVRTHVGNQRHRIGKHAVGATNTWLLRVEPPSERTMLPELPCPQGILARLRHRHLPTRMHLVRGTRPGTAQPFAPRKLCPPIAKTGPGQPRLRWEIRIHRGLGLPPDLLRRGAGGEERGEEQIAGRAHAERG
jgi:hypothetical protein